MRKIVITEKEVTIDENGQKVTNISVESEEVDFKFVVDSLIALVEAASVGFEVSKEDIMRRLMVHIFWTNVDTTESEESGEPINEVESSIDK